MAPSQHLRSKPGKARNACLTRTAWTSRRRTVPMVLMLGGSLLLSGCAAKQSDTAAVVDGTAISDHDVQTVARQLNTLSQGQEQFTPSTALFGLILAPFVLAEGNRTRKNASDEDVLKVIGKVSHPTVSTASFVRMQMTLQKLDPASQNLVGDELGRAKIIVNPRYGTYLPKQGLVPSSPNWIKVAASPVPR